MINKKILYGIAGVVAVVITVILLFNTNDQVQQNKYIYDNLLLKQKLAEQKIVMSSPIKLQKQEDIKQYCTFFTNPQMQDLVEYCTSTELKDNNGNFLGNIHMVGSPSEPKIILILVQTDPTMTKINSVKTIFDTVIQNLVCDCWEEVRPDGTQSIQQWVDNLRQFHLGGTQPHSKSKQIPLDSKSIQMELTTNKDGYLWQLLIYN